MNTPTSPLVRVALIVCAALATIGSGCESCPLRQSVATTAQVDEDVRALLDRWIQSFESRDEAAVRSVLADDERFVWLEDGEARYQSADDVVAALASFPPGLQHSHELTSVRIVPMSDSAAWAQLGTTTVIRQGERAVSEFTGVVLILAQRDNGEWRIIAAHTSTTKPQMRSSG
ncbi:MAG: nuclear transport factor 2 family protein [Phycisphaerales bacterium]|nr:nuclear transport factor 2 family protein [Phycisphaerales bacterium]